MEVQGNQVYAMIYSKIAPYHATFTVGLTHASHTKNQSASWRQSGSASHQSPAEHGVSPSSYGMAGCSTETYHHTQSTSNMNHKKNSNPSNGQFTKPSFGIVTAITSLFFAMIISALAYTPRWENMYCQGNIYFQQPTYWTDIQIVQIRTRNSFSPSWTTVDLQFNQPTGLYSPITPSLYQPILFPALSYPR
jgi:hypothetical protein